MCGLKKQQETKEGYRQGLGWPGVLRGKRATGYPDPWDLLSTPEWRTTGEGLWVFPGIVMVTIVG